MNMASETTFMIDSAALRPCAVFPCLLSLKAFLEVRRTEQAVHNIWCAYYKFLDADNATNPLSHVLPIMTPRSERAASRQPACNVLLPAQSLASTVKFHCNSS